MCSFIITNKEYSDLNVLNRYSKFRGPDATNTIKFNDFYITHNLLSLTGDFSVQPFIKNNISVVFNGEIYNYKEFGSYVSDGECIIDAYLKYGEKFAKYLDGEFAICLLDFNKNIGIICTDVFATKPIWYSLEDNKLSCTSYRSSTVLNNFKNPKKIYANTTLVLDLKNSLVLDQFQNYKFNLEQYKSDYSDWIKSFEDSISKRAYHSKNKKLFLGLSSGYDSGAIACALNKLDIDVKCFSIRGEEDVGIINERSKILKNHEIINFTKKEYEENLNFLKENIEEFFDEEINYKICNDKASVGLSAICNRAKMENRKIYFSGQGVDEIISDYGMLGTKIYNHSCFGGLFPENLSLIYPWKNFYDGNQKMYIAKEEHVAGLHGIETRYPFLDKYVVQEFLNLSCNLKNKNYKSVLHEYLSINNFPFLKNKKVGFRADSNLL